MVRIIKLFLVLAVLGLAGLSAYAYLVDFSPTPQDVTKPVTLNAD